MKLEYINIGIYTIPEAARLTGLGESRVRRWLSGYTYKVSGTRRSRPPVWSGQLAPMRGRRAVSFRDLIEMKFVDAFLRAGVSWKNIRTVQELARKQFNLDHPFSTNRFRTDGNHLVMRALRDEHQASLFDLSTRQQIFLEAATPFREELEMNHDDSVCRWWPLGRDRGVVLDPARCWGRPILSANGLPVEVIERSLAGKTGAEQLTAWHGISAGQIEDALAFVRLIREAA